MILHRFLLFLFVFSPFAALSGQEVTVNTVNTLSSNQLLKSRFNEPLSIIRIPPLYTAEGNVAYGEQEVSFKLHDTAPNAVIVNEQKVVKGQTIDFLKEVNADGGLDIPIYPAATGYTGEAHYTITVSVKGASCPEDYLFSDGMCSKTLIIDATNICPTGYDYLKTEDKCVKELNEPALVTCSEGSENLDGVCITSTVTNPIVSCPGVWSEKYKVCFSKVQDYPGEAYCAHDERVYLIEDTENKKPNHESICVSHGLLDTNDAEYEPCTAGYTLHKWGEGECTDSRAYSVDVETAKPSVDWCEGDGLEYYDNQNYLCIFKNPYMYKANVRYECVVGEYIDGNCVNPSNYQEPSYMCEHGGAYQEISWDLDGNPQLNVCVNREQIDGDSIYSCPENAELNGNKCIAITESEPAYSCPDDYVFLDQSCKLTQTAHSQKACPTGWQLHGDSCMTVENLSRLNFLCGSENPQILYSVIKIH